jgi:Tfp pilus assembly protein PilF
MKVLLFLMALLLVVSCGTHNEQAKRAKKAEFHYKLANGHFYENQIISALKELTTCLEITPEHPDAHHLMGFIFFGRKEYLSAERHFQKALDIRPGFHEVRANMGALLLATHRWQEAIEIIKPLVNATLYPTPWLIHNNLGYANQQLGIVQQALKYYRLALFHNPKFCLGYNNLGTLYKDMGQVNMAVENFRRAITRCKRYAEPHFHLGMLLQKQGQAQAAKREFGACFKVAPESPFGRRCRMRM